jgi:hypothetical protein
VPVVVPADAIVTDEAVERAEALGVPILRGTAGASLETIASTIAAVLDEHGYRASPAALREVTSRVLWTLETQRGAGDD